MEVVTRVTWQRSDFLIVLEVTLADDAFRVLLEVFSVELAQDNFVDHSISFALLVVAMLHIVFVGFAHTREAADAAKSHHSDYQSRPDCRQKQKKPIDEVK